MMTSKFKSSFASNESADVSRLTRMLMSRMLTRLGHQVTTAENGKIALRMLEHSFEGIEGTPKFDIVFLDK